MERGKPDLTVYTFEVPQGQYMRYPDAELWTTDSDEAHAFAEENRYLLMGQDWGEDEPGLVFDYAAHWQVTDTWQENPDRWFMTSEEAHEFVIGTIASYDRYRVSGPDGDEPEPDEED